MIVCATRAGEHSRAVHDTAIRMAVADDQPVTFVHVLDGEEYLGHNPSMQAAIRDEARWLISSLASMAAQHAGATNASTSIEIREGDPLEQIAAATRTEGVRSLVIGEPQAVERSAFIAPDFSAFTESLTAAGIDVVLVN
jgi:nucleotide-binding universal stress UspA family protein